MKQNELKKVKGLCKKSLKGFSGVVHTVNVVSTEGGDYVFVYCDGGPGQEIEIIKNLIIALDTDLGLYIKTERPLPKPVMSLLSKVKRVIIDSTGD